jgi:O-antigen ligase
MNEGSANAIMNAGSHPGAARIDWGSRTPVPNAPAETLAPAVVAGIALLCAIGGISVGVAGVNALTLAAAVISCLVVFYDFRFGVVLLILVLPISASELFPHELFGVTGMNPMNLLMIGTLVSCVFHMSNDRRLYHVAPARLVWLYVVPLALAGILGMRHVGDIAPAFFQNHEIAFYTEWGYYRDLIVKPLFFVLFAVLIGAAVIRSRRPERLLIPMLLSMWVMCLLSIIYFLAADVTLDQLAGVYARQFFTPLGIHANDLGRLYAVAYGLLLFTWAESKNPKLALPLIATMALLIVSLVLTFSRGAFLCFILVNLLFVAWRANAKTMMGALLVGGALAIALPGAVLMRVQLGLGGGVDLDALSAGRLTNIWIPLLPEIWHSPIWGNGLHSVLWAEPVRAGLMFRVVHPHNAYLQALLDVGLVGMALLCAYFVHVWKGFRKLSKDQSQSPEIRGFFQGAAAGLIALMVANFAGSSLYPEVEQVFLWMAVGMMYGLRSRMPSA